MNDIAMSETVLGKSEGIAIQEESCEEIHAMDIASELSSLAIADLNRRNICLLTWNHGQPSDKGEVEKISLVSDLNLDTAVVKDENLSLEFDDNITIGGSCTAEQIQLRSKSSIRKPNHEEETIVEKLFRSTLRDYATLSMPAQEHVHIDTAQQPYPVHRIDDTATTLRSLQPIVRKRLVPPPPLAAASRRCTRGANRRGRRSIDPDSDSESPELSRGCRFNDLKRLRRLGLKILFNELQEQIPATRNKERAPKDVILREATVLCRKLRQEDFEREKLKMKQHQLMMKMEELRAALSRDRVLRTPRNT